jgi:ketosteroid isomerase-like protein
VPSLQEFVNRLRSSMSPPKSNDENISEALQRMVLQMENGESMGAIAEAEERRSCQACGGQNPRGNRFCAKCGVPLQEAAQAETPVAAPGLPRPEETAPGQHHYHHHYHHHYFPPVEGQNSVAASGVTRPAGREVTRGGTPAASVGLSRAEAAVRKLAQDWALACNTKHLDDLVDLYAVDATVVRPNVPPIRTAAAIREYFFGVLEAGLGDVEMVPLRVELLGDFSYEVGRCSMLVPAAMGTRREERGKYVILSARQAGEWKVMVDSWSSDLSLAEPKAQGPVSRTPAKSA